MNQKWRSLKEREMGQRIEELEAIITELVRACEAAFYLEGYTRDEGKTKAILRLMGQAIRQAKEAKSQ